MLQCEQALLQRRKARDARLVVAAARPILAGTEDRAWSTLPPMDERDELAKLAQDFVDLWQEQVAAAAADPAMARWAEAWLAPFQAMAARGDGAPGPAPAGAAPGDLGRRLDEFARRLDACEARLDALERKGRRRRGPDADSARGGRT